jgi:hypothetical protein
VVSWLIAGPRRASTILPIKTPIDGVSSTCSSYSDHLSLLRG